MATHGVEARDDHFGKMTLEEWAALGEGVEGELVDGRLVEEEVADFVHDLCVAWFIYVLKGWLNALGGGLVAASDVKYAVQPGRGRKPDVSVYLPGGRKPQRRGAVGVPPDIAVEVISPTPEDARRDRIEKMDEYATFGIRHYWLLDPDARTFELFELNARGHYERVDAATCGVLRPSGFEGLAVDLDSLWAEVDSLPESDD